MTFVTIWIVAHQASLSMEFPRQEYWSGLPWPPPGDLPNPGTGPEALTSAALAAGSLPPALPGKPCYVCQSLSCVRLFATPWPVACWAPLSMGFSSQEYWSGLPCPSPGDLSDPGIEPRSATLQVDSSRAEPLGKATGCCACLQFCRPPRALVFAVST